MKKYNQILKDSFLFIVFTFMTTPLLCAQDSTSNAEQRQGIYDLVDTYAQARETKDTVLLASILATDVDQLVTSGTWRRGKKESMKGMLKSSAGNPGTRTLKIENIRLLDSEIGIADARYQIQNADGSIRKMWSTFIIAYEEDGWKITAIRNMLPAKSK